MRKKEDSEMVGLIRNSSSSSSTALSIERESRETPAARYVYVAFKRTPEPCFFCRSGSSGEDDDDNEDDDDDEEEEENRTRLKRRSWCCCVVPTWEWLLGMRYYHCEIVVPQAHRGDSCKHCAAMQEDWRIPEDRLQYAARGRGVHWVSYTAIVRHPVIEHWTGVIVVPGKRFRSSYDFVKVKLPDPTNRELLAFLEEQTPQPYYFSCMMRLYFLFSCFVYFMCFGLIWLWRKCCCCCSRTSRADHGSSSPSLSCCCDHRIYDADDYVRNLRGLYCSQLVAAALVKATGRVGIPAESPDAIFQHITTSAEWSRSTQVLRAKKTRSRPTELFYVSELTKHKRKRSSLSRKKYNQFQQQQLISLASPDDFCYSVPIIASKI